MKTLKISLIIFLMALNFGCEKPEIVYSSDTTTKSNTNFKFYLDVNIDGEKFSYSVDTFDMYVRGIMPHFLFHSTVHDGLYFGNLQGSRRYNYFISPKFQTCFFTQPGTTGGYSGIGPFGLDRAKFPKINLIGHIPYFSDLNINDSILNDTMVISNSFPSYNEVFVMAIAKAKRNIFQNDTNTYEFYEAGIFATNNDLQYSTKFDPALPTYQTLQFKLLKKNYIAVKIDGIRKSFMLLDGEFNGKMRNYTEYKKNSDTIYRNFKRFSNVKINFSLPVEIL
jgi:hypothetical protein